MIFKVGSLFDKKYSSSLSDPTWTRGFNAVAKDGVIILSSCITGEGEDNLAENISRFAQRKVIARHSMVIGNNYFSSVKIDGSNFTFHSPYTFNIFRNVMIPIPFFPKRNVTVCYQNGKKVS